MMTKYEPYREMTAGDVRAMEPSFTAGLINALREQIRVKDEQARAKDEQARGRDEQIALLRSELAYLMKVLTILAMALLLFLHF